MSAKKLKNNNIGLKGDLANMIDEKNKLKAFYADRYELIEIIHDSFFKVENKDQFIGRVLTGQDREVYFYNETICISKNALPNQPINDFIHKIDKINFLAILHSTGLLLKKK